MTATEIERILVGYGPECMWSPQRVKAFPNIFYHYWEADLLIVQPSRAVWEIEIKTSVADFKRDFTKKPDKHELLRTVKPPPRRYASSQVLSLQKFYFAMPWGIWEQVESLIPKYAGVISFPPDHLCKGNGRQKAKIVKKARNLTDARMTNQEYTKCLESIYNRHWGKILRSRWEAAHPYDKE